MRRTRHRQVEKLVLQEDRLEDQLHIAVAKAATRMAKAGQIAIMGGKEEGRRKWEALMM